MLARMQGSYVATSLGRTAWKDLVAGASLQPNCNAEGFNLVSGGDYQAVRLGILGNNENDCGTSDSRIGFGGQESALPPRRRRRRPSA